MRLKRIPYRIWHYSRKLAYSKKTSSPYLSPDTFMRIADLNLDRDFNQEIELIRQASVVFVNSGDIEKFFSEYGKIINAKVLIFGNNDVDFTEFRFSIPRSVKKVYLQNSTVIDDLFSAIPIGIERLRYVTNGVPKLFDDRYAMTEKNQKVLVGPFSATHPERKFLTDSLNPNSINTHHCRERLSPADYARLAASYSFIACPRGNGFDTHRFWETLYRGSIPVVIKSNWSKYFSNLGIPMVELESWAEIENGVQSSTAMNMSPRMIPAIWEKFWIEKIRAHL
jgi:hypothetical protein